MVELGIQRHDFNICIMTVFLWRNYGFLWEKKKTSSLGITVHIPQNGLPFLKNKKTWCGCLIYALVLVLVCWFDFCFNSILLVFDLSCVLLLNFRYSLLQIT